VAQPLVYAPFTQAITVLAAVPHGGRLLTRYVAPV